MQYFSLSVGKAFQAHRQRCNVASLVKADTAPIFFEAALCGIFDLHDFAECTYLRVVRRLVIDSVQETSKHIGSIR